MRGVRRLLVLGLVMTTIGSISYVRNTLLADVVHGFAPVAPRARVKVARRAPAERGDHYIFVLTNAADGLYIGTRASLAGRTAADFEGGGANEARIAYRELAGPFATRDAAETALAAGLGERREFPISVGARARWRGDDRWYGLWSPTVATAL